MTVFIPS